MHEVPTTALALLQHPGEDSDLFTTGQRERLTAAYGRRAGAVAYRATNATQIDKKKDR
jgi:hypothetical protein